MYLLFNSAHRTILSEIFEKKLCLANGSIVEGKQLVTNIVLAYIFEKLLAVIKQ